MPIQCVILSLHFLSRYGDSTVSRIVTSFGVGGLCEMWFNRGEFNENRSVTLLEIVNEFLLTFPIILADPGEIRYKESTID